VGQCGVTTWTLPLSAAEDEAPVAVLGVNLKIKGRNPWSCTAVAGQASALEVLLQILRLVIVLRQGEVPGCCVTVIGCDHEAASGCEPLHEIPEVFAAELLRGFFGQALQACIAGINPIIRPVVPQNEVGIGSDVSSSLGPGNPHALGLGTREAVSAASSIGLKRRPLSEAERLSERSRLARHLGNVHARGLNCVPQLRRRVKNPRDFPQG